MVACFMHPENGTEIGARGIKSWSRQSRDKEPCPQIKQFRTFVFNRKLAPRTQNASIVLNEKRNHIIRGITRQNEAPYKPSYLPFQQFRYYRIIEAVFTIVKFCKLLNILSKIVVTLFEPRAHKGNNTRATPSLLTAFLENIVTISMTEYGFLFNLADTQIQSRTTPL